MILSDEKIREFMARSNDPLVITPPPSDLCHQPASVDLTLSNGFMRLPAGARIDPRNPPALQRYEVPAQVSFTLRPHDFVLASTVEYVRIPRDLVAIVEGKSSLARIGLKVHVTAGYIDPGFEGNITLELCNMSGNNDIELMPGMRISQLAFHRVDGKVQRPYGHPDLKSKYQRSAGTCGPKPER